MKKSTRPHSLSRLPRLKLVWIGTCENVQRRSGSAGKGRAKSNAGTCRWLRVAATDVAFVGRPFAEQRSWVNDASTEIHELPRRAIRRAGKVGRGEEMRGCDDCREPEGEIERRPPRLPPRVKRARLLSETTNRILTSIHVLYLRVCVRASPRSRCLCRDGRKGEPDLFSCAAKPT